MRVPKPNGHLWKFLATGAAGLTVGTVQGVIQVQPGNADWLYRAGHAGEWIDPISHAHINLVTGLTMLVAGALFASHHARGRRRRAHANACFWRLLAGRSPSTHRRYTSASTRGVWSCGTGSPRGGGGGDGGFIRSADGRRGMPMLAAFWLLLGLVARAYRTHRRPARGFVYAGCAALAVGTLQGPVQAFPAVHELLDRGGDAGA